MIVLCMNACMLADGHVTVGVTVQNKLLYMNLWSSSILL